MKYPRTPHLPMSLGGTSDDKRLSSIGHLRGKTVVITEKLDGEQLSMHRDRIHARSEEGSNQPWRSYAKAIHAKVRSDIPENIQIVGEYMYAQHSIRYDRLTDWYYVFLIIDKQHELVLSVDETIETCELLGLSYVPILYRGTYDPDKFIMPPQSAYGPDIEGYVVRRESEFAFSDFGNNVAKWVRADHVQTDKHWTKTWIPNKIKE